MLSAKTWVRFGRLLCLVLWIGGIAFFAFAVAPVAFGRLSSAHEAGLVVGGTLRVLHGLGLCCGVVFVALTAIVFARIAARRLVITEFALVLGMLCVTAYSQFGVLPAMEVYRVAAGGDIASADAADPSRRAFERLHTLSERLEGAVLLCGLALLLGVTAEPDAQASDDSHRHR